MNHAFLLGEPFIELSVVDSTNNYAMARISEGPVAEGTAYFAWKQTEGKGQRGKSWQSEMGENIILSLVLQPVRLRLEDQFMLSVAIALGVRDFFETHAGDSTRIKWSNDIYWNDKKAGGLLIENILRGNSWAFAIAGIGLNINQVHFDAALPNPVSLRQITGERQDVLALARELCRYVGLRYEYLQPAHFVPLLREYTSLLYLLGVPALYRIGGEIFEAVIRGVEANGRLILEKGTRRISADFGEVEFIRT